MTGVGTKGCWHGGRVALRGAGSKEGWLKRVPALRVPALGTVGSYGLLALRGAGSRRLARRITSLEGRWLRDVSTLRSVGLKGS